MRRLSFLLLVLWNAARSDAQRGFAAPTTAKMALDIMSRVSDGDDRNIILSPSSIFTGAAMLYAGSDGSTRQAVQDAMGFPKSDDAFLAEIRRVSSENSLAEVSPDKAKTGPEDPKFVANMITVSKESQMKPSYAQVISQDFRGNPYTEDFAKNPEKSRRNVNLWVSRRTNNKIRELMPEGSVQELTKVVLVNALYFKDNWTVAFDEQTNKAPFTLEDGRKVTADMMQGEIFVGYKRFPNAQVVSIPFQSQKYQMVVVLPSQGAKIDQLLDMLQEPSSPVMNAILDPLKQLQKETILLTMPRFQSKMTIELQDTFKQIPGLRDLVSQNADLSRMTSQPTKVETINHQATIDVDTNGVESAAATAISVVLYSNFAPAETVELNRPFAYFIVETSTGMIHVAGVLKNPLRS